MAVNRPTFLYRDAAGQFCRPSAALVTVGDTPIQKTFPMRSLCFPTGVRLQKGVRYVILVKRSETLPTLPRPVRLLTDPFRTVAQIGVLNGDQAFFDPDPDLVDSMDAEIIKPNRDGELFLYINDVLISLPGLEEFGFRSGVGTAEVTIRRR
jgi:hypothetical protein